VALASEDVRDGALSISLAQRTRHAARTALTLAVAPGVLLALAVAFGLMSPAIVPVGVALAALACALHARANDLGSPKAAPLSPPLPPA
jgi:hypothetical protein